MLFISGGASIGLGQSQPNLENGFKPYGSYDGTKVEVVNLQNGNLIWNIPSPFQYPQRGSLNPVYSFYLTSKNWQVQTGYMTTDSGGFAVYQWQPGVPAMCVKPFQSNTPVGDTCAFPAGTSFTSSLNLTVKRTIETQISNGVTARYASAYSLATGDLATHGLYPVPGTADATGEATRFESMDTTGYRVQLSNPDSNGIMNTVVVTDRAGNRYQGTFPDSGSCISHMPRNPWDGVPSAGGYMPTADGGAGTTDAFCGQVATISTVTDRNGNTFNLGTNTDTLGRTMPAGTPASDTSDCVSPLPISGAMLYGPAGANNQIKFCYSSFPIQTNFSQTGVAQAQASGVGTGLFPVTAMNLVATIVLPDHSKWTFNYDSYGEVSYVGLPLGGSISYTWTEIAFQSCNPVDGTRMSRAVASRTVSDGNGNSSTWNYNWGVQTNNVQTNTVTDPSNNDTVHVFTGESCNAHETRTQYYQGTGASRTLLKQVDTAYTSAPVPYDDGADSLLGNYFATDITTTVYPSGKVSKVHRNPDAGLGGTNAPIYGNVVQEFDYDWGQGAPGALLRETDTTFLWQNDARYQTANILDLPASLVTKDPNGSRVAETDSTYDESAYLTGYEANVGTLPAGTHLAAPNPSPVRGNLSTISKWLNTGSPVASHTNWYDTGEVYQQIDPLGQATTHSYDLAYAGAYSTQTCAPKTNGNTVAHCVSGTYVLNTGLLTSFTNENATTQASGNTPGDSAHTSTYAYDSMWRITSATFPPDPANNKAQAQTTFTYSAANSFPFKVTRTKSITPSLSDSVTTSFDGLGRAYKTQHVLPNGTAEVDTSYDVVGRVAGVTNPYFSSSDPTYGVTQNAYDALGRITQVTKQDGSASTVVYQQAAATSANADCTTTTDETGKQRKSCVDGLGRLIEVDEPQASTGSMTNPYVTLYSYDALGNLLQVNQKGDGSQAARVRTFTYDSLSRLLTANNPESGTISYSYDGNGNVLQKTSPAPNQTGSATETISYCYDALNRATGKVYSATTTCPLSSSAVTWAYDSGTNGIGHLTSLIDQAGSGSYSYDVMGRIAGESRTLAGITKSMSYLYNLDGSIQSLTYPSGAVITYTPDAAGRMLSAVDNGNHINYVTGSGGPNPAAGATYGPDGSLLSFNQGWTTSFAGIANSFSYNPRLQPVNMAAVSPGTTGTSATASVAIGGSLQTATQAAAAGSPMTTVASGGVTTTHVLMPGGHLYALYCSGNPMTCSGKDETAAGGNFTPAGGSPLVTALSSQTPYTFFFNGGQIYDNWCPTSGCAWDDPYGDAGRGPDGAAPAIASASPLNVVATTNGLIGYYLNPSGHLIWLNTSHGFSNTWQDVTAAGGNITAAAGSQMVTVLNGQSPNTYFFSGDGQVEVNWCTTSGCSWDNPYGDAASGPDGPAPTPNPGGPLNAVVTTNGIIAYYISTSGHLIALNTSLGFSDTWQDVTAAGGNFAPASGSPLVTVLNGQTPTTFFFSGGQLINNWCTSSTTCAWDNPFADTSRGPNGQAPAIASGSPLNVVAAANGLIAYYLSTSGHVIALNTSLGFSDTWQDVTALAAPDSGMVSLSVGRFTATACFGTSISPASACSGQPVNSSPSQVASALVAALNSSASPVTATANGATINLTWKATGPFTTAVSALSTTHDDPSLFPNPSFTSAATNFSGGSGANVPVFSLNYDFHVGNGDNGDVLGITNNKDTTRNQTFTYDALNRLTSAQNAGTDCTKTLLGGKTEYWGNNYGYDPWGNLLSKSVTKCSAENLSVTALANNQLSGYSYDAAGNMTHDATSGLNYSYDQENRITGANGFTYIYDANGNRAEKSNGTTGTLYWYMAPGIVAESDLSGNLQSEYAFFNGERLARKDFPSNAVSYYFSDHLTTTDIVTDAQGNIKNESAFYPWGGELQFLANDSNHYKFTGKERDSETQLDYFGARYYSNGLGRFITPDWAAKPIAVPYADFGNPQSLNLYSYVKNNPTTMGDSDGHCGSDVTCYINLVAGVVSGVLRDGGVEPYAKNLGIGAGKGLGALAVKAERMATAPNMAAGIASQALPLPKAVTPSNLTQAQASIVTQTVVPAAAGVAAGPLIGALENASTAGSATSAVLTGTRYVGAGEAAVIEQTGMVPNTNAAGVPKQVFYTPESPMSSASAAQDAYQLPNTPTHAVELNTSNVHNTYGGNVENGNGIELVTHDQIPATSIKKLEP